MSGPETRSRGRTVQGAFLARIVVAVDLRGRVTGAHQRFGYLEGRGYTVDDWNAGRFRQALTQARHARATQNDRLCTILDLGALDLVKQQALRLYRIFFQSKNRQIDGAYGAAMMSRSISLDDVLDDGDRSRQVWSQLKNGG